MPATPPQTDSSPSPACPPGWEVVIGLEVHAQLRTRAKLFSAAPNVFGDEPNSNTTEVELGMPGVLPVINERAVELALRAALALGCDVHHESRFARKHYFYPDLPKGYQISQYDEPYCTGGAVPIRLDGETRSIPLTRIHMEEDAGKSIHDDAVTGAGVSHVDLNRAGVPLVEIVSEPAIRTPAEAGAYLRSLRSILRYLDVSDANMEKGHFRCDANVSVRRPGETELGVKVELKNLNSFKHVEKGLAYEIERQVETLEDGGTIVQETRHWDETENRSTPGRKKENAEDYRYFPDPDLVPLRIDPEHVARVRAALPELPGRKRQRFVDEFGLPDQDAALLSEDREVAEFFEQTVAGFAQPKVVSNWIMRSLLGTLSETGLPLAELPLTPGHLARLLELVDAGRVNAASARRIFSEMAKSGAEPEQIMRDQGLEAVSDTAELESMARAALDANPKQLEQYRGGEQKLLNFFVGQVMKASGGKADPAAVREILDRLLSA
ncbi:MAG: Asp-tRNA(Asn)/Glu-tRNA(Gln) amidotransferase subunit GatB [Deltaproteobacteria bacterium]|nr:Asp-tRNA(Asn)/Glu-tRNA(Gln) amidotransferase subunit GatB [Deltaproteobacteria bacterium]